MRVEPKEPKRYPWWQLILLGFVSMLESAILRPLRRLWVSEDPLDTYALVHLTSAGGDAMVAIALAGSIFFDIPVDEAKVKVALYLALTMAPLAVAGPLLVPLLDRAGPRRAISLSAALGRCVVAVVAAPRFGTTALYPLAFLLLVLSKVHTITKNGLTMAYAGPDEGLVRANARLGRIAVGGVMLMALPGIVLLKIGGAEAVLYGAAVVYGTCALLNLRLPRATVPKGEGEVGRRGSIAALTAPAIGAAGLRLASGFLLFALAFALRRSGEPTWWFGVLAACGTAGGVAGDLLAPRLPTSVREEAVVIACIAGAGLGAVLAFTVFSLPVLAVFGLVVGMSSELGRLAFQSLMQQLAPGGAHGRVFVRYEVIFQLAWVAGALLPAMLRIEFREAFLILFGLYVVVGLGYLAPPLIEKRRAEASDDRRIARPARGRGSPMLGSDLLRRHRGGGRGDMANWVKVGESGEVGDGEMSSYTVGDRMIAIANIGGDLHAFDDVCTHKQCSLSEGEIDGTVVECPCHGGQFDILSGEVVEGPPLEPIDIFEVREEGGELQVSLE